MPTSPVRRPGGRSALVVASVRRAVQELVVELGAERVTIAQVAERSGVAATTIYRRWADLPTLLGEVAAYRLDPDRPLPDTGTLAGDLVEWAQEFSRHVSRPENAALLRAGAALAGDGRSDCTVNRRREAGVLVERARDRGDTGRLPSPEDVIDALLAPVTYRTIFTPDEPVDDVPRRVERLLAP